MSIETMSFQPTFKSQPLNQEIKRATKLDYLVMRELLKSVNTKLDAATSVSLVSCLSLIRPTEWLNIICSS